MFGCKNKNFLLVATLLGLVALGYYLYVSTMMTTFGPAMFGNGLSGILDTCVHKSVRSECTLNAIISIIGFSLGTAGVISKENGYFKRDRENPFSELAEQLTIQMAVTFIVMITFSYIRSNLMNR